MVADTPTSAAARTRATAAPPRLRSLDGLRGLGIAAVLVFHAGVGLPGAFLAVSMFFTLSGFLITALLLGEHKRHDRISLSKFWGRRFRRLLPAALLAIALCAILVWRSDNPGWSSSFRLDGLSALGYVANWRFVFSSQAYEAVYASPSTVQHFWSLAIEEQVYLLLPPLTVGVLFLARGSRRVLGWLLAALFVVSAAIPTLFGISGDRVYFGTDTRIAEVLAGSLLAVFLTSHAPSMKGSGLPTPPKNVLTIIGGIATIVMLGLWVVVNREWGWVSQGGLAIYSLLSVLVIVAALVPESPMTRALSWKPIAALGVISYGVYLYHWPIFLWLLPRTPDWNPWLQLAVGGSVAIVLGALSFRYIEQPIHQGVRTRRAASSPPPETTARRARPAIFGQRPGFASLAACSAVAVTIAVVAVTASPPATSSAKDVLSRPPGALVSNVPEEAAAPRGAPTRQTVGTADTPTPIPAPPPSSAPAGTVPITNAPTTEPPVTSSPSTTIPPGPLQTKPLQLPNAPLRLLVMGDSSAVMLMPAIHAWGEANHAWVLSNYARIGCGIGRGGQRMNGDRAEPIPVECADFTQEWPDIIRRVRPDIVLIADSFWDSTDRQLQPGGPWLGPGDASYDEYLRGELGAATDIAASYGAKVMWLDNAPIGFGRELVPPRTDFVVNDPARQERFNAVLDQIAASRPSMRVIPFAEFIQRWPGGLFALRPDGLHVDEAGAVNVLAWLGPEVLATYWDAALAPAIPPTTAAAPTMPDGEPPPSP